MLKKILLLFLLVPVLSWAQPFPQKPSDYVTDEAGVLSSEQLSSLNSKCRNFEAESTNQIFVYITKSLKGRDMFELSQEIFSSWEIGQAGKDNGVLVAVFIDDHQFRIHTGYGLEGQLPDLVTKEIQDETMGPYFKEGDYYTGISEGLDKLIYYSRNEYVPEQPSIWPAIIAIGIFVLVCYGINGLFLWAVRSTITDNEKLKPKTKKVLYILGWIFFAIPFAGAFLMGFMAAIFGKRGGGGGKGSSGRWSSSSSGSSRSSFGGGGGGRSGGGGSSSSW
jgi:uncharacterized protein